MLDVQTALFATAAMGQSVSHLQQQKLLIHCQQGIRLDLIGSSRMQRTPIKIINVESGNCVLF